MVVRHLVLYEVILLGFLSIFSSHENVPGFRAALRVAPKDVVIAVVDQPRKPNKPNYQKGSVTISEVCVVTGK